MYSMKKKDSKKTGGGPACRYTVLESFYEQIFGWQANVTGIQGDGLHEFGLPGIQIFRHSALSVKT